MMKDIAIFGAGGFGKEVACLIRRINEEYENPIWNLIGFFDDDPSKKNVEISHFGRCFGGVEVVNSWEKPLSVAISIGAPKSVERIISNIKNDFIDFPNIIHPTFKVADSSTFHIGNGNIIQGSCYASCDVSIGNFNIMNGEVMLGHDVVVGNYNSFMPDNRISGNVTIGSRNFFGVGCIVLQQLRIGNDVRLGAGSVLMTKPKDGQLYMGNPARKIKF